MSFELPDNVYHELDPLRESAEKERAEWQVPIDRIESLVHGDEGLAMMLEDTFDQCLRYTRSVLEQISTLAEEGRGELHAEKDYQRTLTHTATQDTIRALCRNLIRAGRTSEELYPLLPNPESRAACGAFALRLTLTRGMKELTN